MLYVYVVSANAWEKNESICVSLVPPPLTRIHSNIFFFFSFVFLFSFTVLWWDSPPDHLHGLRIYACDSDFFFLSQDCAMLISGTQAPMARYGLVGITEYHTEWNSSGTTRTKKSRHFLTYARLQLSFKSFFPLNGQLEKTHFQYVTVSFISTPRNCAFIIVLPSLRKTVRGEWGLWREASERALHEKKKNARSATIKSSREVPTAHLQQQFLRASTYFLAEEEQEEATRNTRRVLFTRSPLKRDSFCVAEWRK